MAQEITLIRMNGLGNDFLIYDGFESERDFSTEEIISLSSRKNQITKGCDQFIILNRDKNSDGYMHIYNADGGQVAACGNATRCVGQILFEKLDASEASINTDAGRLMAYKISESEVKVNMGKPDFNWQNIPLARAVDVDNLPILVQGLGTRPMATSIGNPHMVFFLNTDIENLDINEYGPSLENHSLFPERTNVNFANARDKNNIRLRVFERGVGETLACGTGACATAICAIKKGLVNNSVHIEMNGGTLKIDWDGTEEVFMTGATELEGIVAVKI